MFNKEMNQKGKIIYNMYLSPPFNRLRLANTIMVCCFGIGIIVGLIVIILMPIDIFAWIFLLSLAGFIFTIFNIRSYQNTIVIYQNGIECKCGIPRNGGSSWSVGKKYIPYEQIESIYHRTDIGKPIVQNFSIGFLIVEIKVKDKKYVGFIPPYSQRDVFRLLEEHFGLQWKNIYKAPLMRKKGPIFNNLKSVG